MKKTVFALHTGDAEITCSKCRVKNWNGITTRMLEDNALDSDGLGPGVPDEYRFATFEAAKAEYDRIVSRFTVGSTVGVAGVTKSYAYAFVEEEHYIVDVEDLSEEYDDQDPDNGLRTPVAVEPIVKPDPLDNVINGEDDFVAYVRYCLDEDGYASFPDAPAAEMAREAFFESYIRLTWGDLDHYEIWPTNLWIEETSAGHLLVWCRIDNGPEGTMERCGMGVDGNGRWYFGKELVELIG